MNNKNLMIGGVVLAGIVAYYFYNKDKGGVVSNAPSIEPPRLVAPSVNSFTPNAIAPNTVVTNAVIPNRVNPKPRIEEIVTASVPVSRPIDVVVSPTMKYKNLLIKNSADNAIYFVNSRGVLVNKEAILQNLKTDETAFIDSEAEKNIVDQSVILNAPTAQSFGKRMKEGAVGIKEFKIKYNKA
jgi:hypothetical protein